MRDGTNSVKVAKQYGAGVASLKSLLITGWYWTKYLTHVGATNSPSLDKLWGVIMFIVDFINWLKGLFNKEDTVIKTEEVAAELGINKVKRTVNKKKTSDIENNWVDGEYKSVKDLLHDVNYRYDWLRGFKPSMSERHLRAIKKFGVFMGGTYGSEEWIDYHEYRKDAHISIGGNKNRKTPTFMAIAYHSFQEKYEERELIGFEDIILYASKEKWKFGLWNVEKPRGKYFYMFGFVARLTKKKYHSIEVPIEILPDGTLNILKMMNTEMVEIPLKKGGSTSYSKQNWGKYCLPPTTRFENIDSREERDALADVNTKNMFKKLYLNYMRMDASTTIHATKGMARMIFTVPVHTWKEFFKDRVTTQASDGKKKRIFHHVAAHRRSNGQLVPMHTRGVTRFKWDGFNIKICEMKRGRVSLTDFDLVGEVMSDEEVSQKHNDGETLVGLDYVAAKMVPVLTRDLHSPSNKVL
jgi:hypothetical protein